MKHPFGERKPSPTQPVRWPRQDAVVIEQLKASSQPSRVVQGVVSQVPTANMPKPVVVTGTIKGPVNNLTRRISISFIRDPSDVYFQKVNVHLKFGNGQPTHLVSGVTSPIRVTVPVSGAAATFFLQTEGNWGANPLQNSPAKSLSLL